MAGFLMLGTLAVVQECEPLHVCSGDGGYILPTGDGEGAGGGGGPAPGSTIAGDGEGAGGGGGPAPG
jgi:hypothetical protein